jgi:hypothetical protein
LESISPYSQSKKHRTEKLEKEHHDEFEVRTWRDKAHVNDDGFVFIPPMPFKEALASAAKFAGEKIPGKRNATWTKHFVSGIIVPAGIVLPIRKEDVKEEWINANADGVKGSGKRVDRCFPLIPKWSGVLEFIIIDDTITEDVFTKYLELAGQLVGIGRWRAEKGGMYGRFVVKSVEWKDER